MSQEFIFSFLDRCRDCVDRLSLETTLHETVKSIGFPRWAYVVDGVIKHNYPPEWVERYIASSYGQIDPIVTRGVGLAHPFRWSDLAPFHSLSRLEQEYYSEAIDFGLNDGIAIPISTRAHPALLTFASDESPKTLDEIIIAHSYQFVALAYAFHTVNQSLATDGMAVQNPLTPREIECLSWAFNSKTSSEIGQILSISERTVVFHIENAKRKLGAQNRTQAIIKALTCGYIKA